MKAVLPILLLLPFGWAAGQSGDPRLERLEAAYNRLQQEQQSRFQQFQMLQELRRNELQDASAPAGTRAYSATGMDSRIVDYDDNARQQQQRQERLQRYDQEMDLAYRRYLDLDNQKKALLDQMLDLQQPGGARR
ncbi:MAG TPA: hypothetical protein VF096_00545 [Azonexus sp.]